MKKSRVCQFSCILIFSVLVCVTVLYKELYNALPHIWDIFCLQKPQSFTTWLITVLQIHQRLISSVNIYSWLNDSEKASSSSLLHPVTLVMNAASTQRSFSPRHLAGKWCINCILSIQLQNINETYNSFSSRTDKKDTIQKKLDIFLVTHLHFSELANKYV